MSLAADSAHLTQAIYDHYTIDEEACVAKLLQALEHNPLQQSKITQRASSWIHALRKRSDVKWGIESLLQHYHLGSQEGIILMSLAEALLRIPDEEVAQRFLRHKIERGNWSAYLSKKHDLNTRFIALIMIVARYILTKPRQQETYRSLVRRTFYRLSAPLVSVASRQAMQFMGRQFVLGDDMPKALARSQRWLKEGYTFSYDMLGEAALTQADAERYFDAYRMAITQAGVHSGLRQAPALGVSVKLSALHPRYQATQRDRVLHELGAKLAKLAEYARLMHVGLTIDAEEADRLEISLELYEQVLTSKICDDWNGLGLVVQAYSKRALPVLRWLRDLAERHQKRIPVRLVKGAYWDSEIKHAQELGISGLPLFTRKASTDVSYLVCAQFLLEHRDVFYPQFATHNAHTVASVLEMAGDFRDFEFQRLHGMGEALYDIVRSQNENLRCRIYAPVGHYRDLLPYLVRRLLENGANSSFVHQVLSSAHHAEDLARHPADTLKQLPQFAHERILLPCALYGAERENSMGVNFNSKANLEPLAQEVRTYLNYRWQASPLIDGQAMFGEEKTVYCPYYKDYPIGTTVLCEREHVQQALKIARDAWTTWDETPVTTRALYLRKFADIMEQSRGELIALCCREGGKTLVDAVAEIREAVDFCRYYAARAEQIFERPMPLPGPTGEVNELYWQGRGVFVCISPWNFPLAIFIGQVVAALVAGNCVLAKPAGQTTLVAHRAIQLLLQTGLPASVLHFVPCSGRVMHEVLSSDLRVSGVAFTGSTETAFAINRALAARNCPIAPLIAETGGQNAMIVDSTALPEQVVQDVIQSAFNSAGQRCSALRVLYVQEEISDKIIEMLKGAMQELRMGDPSDVAVDVGPVIDEVSRVELLKHVEQLKANHQLLAQTPIDADLQQRGYFVAPAAFSIQNIQELTQEHFGPLLHIICYKASDLDQVVKSINDYGYGLTFGIHSRDETWAYALERKIRAGNVYINRNMIGAVVGVQPFGGQGLSGTGPKAGGPHYLQRFATERCRTNNIAALGGNTALLNMD